MALCSYDNALNQRYNFIKDIEMAQQTAEQKAAEAAKKAEKKAQEEAAKAAEEKAKAEAEAKAKLEAEQKAAEADDTMTILDALEEAERSRKVRRRSWNKALSGHFVTIRRGETLPVLSTGKHFSSYKPSIVDVMAKDWYVVEGDE